MKEEIVDSRCRICFELNPQVDSSCDKAENGKHRLEAYSFPGHKGRPGKEGGSLPKSAGGGAVAPASKSKSALDSFFERVVTKHAPHITTLETRNRDSLDFHDVGVSALKSMLNDAYEGGMKVGVEVGINSCKK